MGNSGIRGRSRRQGEFDLRSGWRLAGWRRPGASPFSNSRPPLRMPSGAPPGMGGSCPAQAAPKLWAGGVRRFRAVVHTSICIDRHRSAAPAFASPASVWVERSVWIPASLSVTRRERSTTEGAETSSQFSAPSVVLRFLRVTNAEPDAIPDLSTHIRMAVRPEGGLAGVPETSRLASATRWEA
jgi:hypothetical protein